MFVRLPAAAVPSLLTRLLRAGGRHTPRELLPLGFAFAMVASSVLSVATAAPAYASDPEGSGPSIQYLEALSHATKTYSFTPGGVVNVPFRAAFERRGHGRRRGTGRPPGRSRKPRPRTGADAGSHFGERSRQYAAPRGPSRDRGRPAGESGDRADRGAVPDECRRDRRQARRAGGVGEDRRRPRHPQRVGTGQDPARDRAAGRREPADRAEQPVQAHGRAEHVPRERGRVGRRRAANAQPAGVPAGVARPSSRGRDPPVAVPARPRGGAAAHRRRPGEGARHDRRGREGDSRREGSAGRA